MDKKITAERIRELLCYDPNSGVFTWLMSRGPVRAGSVAGSPDSKGYVIICAEYTAYKAHRLAWLYVHGVWPTDDIDHKNQIKTDNRISNLREATTLQNQRNQTQARRHSGTGVRGVRFDARYGTYTAYLCKGDKYKSLGTFQTIGEAAAARRSAEIRREKETWEAHLS